MPQYAEIMTVHNFYRTAGLAYRAMERSEMERIERSGKPRNGIEVQEHSGPRNYGNPEPLNTSHIGKTVTITLVNGRIESGKLKALGAYRLSIEDRNGRELIVNKGAIVTVSIL